MFPTLSKPSTLSRPRGGVVAGLTGVNGKVTVCCDGRDIISLVAVWLSGVNGGVCGDVAGVSIPGVVDSPTAHILFGVRLMVLIRSPLGLVEDIPD